MKIFIKRNWWGRYYIYQEDKADYSFYGTSGYLIWRGDYAKIYNTLKEEVLYVKQGKIGAIWNLNKITYLLDFIKGKKAIEIKAIDYLNGHWTFDTDGNRYDFYLHNRYRKSLYKEQNQVAIYAKMNGGTLIVANNDEDAVLLTGLFMAFNMGDTTPDADIALNSSKEENPNWKPNI